MHEVLRFAQDDKQVSRGFEREANSQELTAGLRFDRLHVRCRTPCFRSIRFPMTDWRNVRLGERPSERPRLLVTARQHEVETAAWGSRSS